MLLKDVELLAPAGDMEGLTTALKYGADAIYCGGPFMQLRAESAGFSMEKLEEAAKAVHAKGKRLYVTVNSFANNDEIEKLGPYAKELKAVGVDAVIVSDIGAASEIKEQCPEMELHISTQANTMNYKAAQLYYKMGAKRIVLARELNIEKIKQIRDNTPDDLELEAFVHGAMCMSYSGRCLLSAYLAGRSGNRGQCAQTCRWNYYLMEEKRPGEFFKVEESEHGSTILSSKELCCIEFLDKLADAGVCSFKIEGRMRTPFYTATVVNAYKAAMNGTYPMADLKAELDTVSHRPFTSGFYLSEDGALNPDDSGYVRDWLFVASVMDGGAAGETKVVTRNPFAVGDELELLSPGKLGRKFAIERIIDDEGNSIDRSKTPMRVMTINIPYDTEPGDIIRKHKTE